jgi:pSer/pThr/pTyr-binding forkhead associated (FHA) protein
MPRVTLTIPGLPPQPYRFELDRRTVSFGRGPENDIVVDSPSVSTRHAEMLRVGNSYELRDLHSTNGTKLNGERHLSIPLASGTVAQLGDVDFEFQLSDDELAALRGTLTPPVRVALPVATPNEPAAPSEPAAKPAPVALLVEEDEDDDADYEPPAGMSFAKKLLILLLIVLAVLLGMSLRHQKDTGKTLLDEWNEPAPAKTSGETEKAAPAEEAAPKNP